MALNAQHPQYFSKFDDWVITNDVFQGERHIKTKKTTYLPPTAGMVLDGMVNATQPGMIAYESYIKRAVFPSYFRDAIETAVGLMHRKEAEISLPAALEPMRESATVDGESLELLLRKMNEAQLKDGRCGLLLDVPSGEGPTAMPFIAFYPAARIMNWDDGQRIMGRKKLEMVVLNESEFVRKDSLQWVEVAKYRPLMLSSALATVYQEDQAPVADGTYITGISAENSLDIETVKFVAPSLAGKTMTEIPFVFVNASDIASDVGIPPLLGLANLCLGIYRAEADYRQALHAQAQETLVIIGSTDEMPVAGVEGAAAKSTVRVGAGGKIEVPLGGDAKYIGISSKGLSEMRSSLENDRDFAQQQGSRMLSTKGGDQQSGDALKTRVAAQTASLPNIAMTAAEALQRILRIAAVLKGANPEEVVVMPNLDFTADIMTGQNLLNYMQAKAMGAPLSKESLHELMKEQGLTDMEFSEEMDALDTEGPVVPLVPTRGVPGAAAKPAGK